MNITILDFTVIISCVLGYFISLSLLISPFYKNRANTYLSISLFILTSISFLGWYDADSGIFALFQSIMWEFLIPITLFTYFLIQIEHRYVREYWYKWLYFPFLITFVIDVLLQLDFNFSFYNSSFNEDDFIVQLFYDLEGYLSLLYNIVLILWSRYLINRAITISNEKKRWLLRLNLFIIIIVIIWFISDIEEIFFDSGFYTKTLWVVLSFLSWWILYYGVFKLQIITQKNEIHNFISSQKGINTPIKKKRNEAVTSKIISQLYVLMDEGELYKNPLLSRLDLAKQLGISESNLSQVINREINESVIQFVNNYRISFAKKLLHNTVFNKYAVDAIGLEAGFKSKSAFYSAFKIATGISPGAYRKLQKES